jgi:hypothetical protein
MSETVNFFNEFSHLSRKENKPKNLILSSGQLGNIHILFGEDNFCHCSKFYLKRKLTVQNMKENLTLFIDVGQSVTQNDMVVNSS